MAARRLEKYPDEFRRVGKTGADGLQDRFLGRPDAEELPGAFREIDRESGDFGGMAEGRFTSHQRECPAAWFQIHAHRPVPAKREKRHRTGVGYVEMQTVKRRREVRLAEFRLDERHLAWWSPDRLAQDFAQAYAAGDPSFGVVEELEARRPGNLLRTQAGCAVLGEGLQVEEMDLNGPGSHEPTQLIHIC